MVLRARAVGGQREFSLLPSKAQRAGTVGVKWHHAVNLRTGHPGKVVSRGNTSSKQAPRKCSFGPCPARKRRLDLPAMGPKSGAISRNTKPKAVQSIRLEEDFSIFHYL